jgi:hypothetical protein
MNVKNLEDATVTTEPSDRGARTGPPTDAEIEDWKQEDTDG